MIRYSGANNKQLIVSLLDTLKIEGHRGARGLAPENTLASFEKALDIGVTGIEFDVGISKDNHVVVVHDREINPAVARNASGKWLSETGPAIWYLTLKELRKYDVGRLDPNSEYGKGFPSQQAVDGAGIPTLEEVVECMDQRGFPDVELNIELKLSPHYPDATMYPEAFADRVVYEINQLGLVRRTKLQCFYWRVLQQIQEMAPDIRTSYLTSERTDFDTINPTNDKDSDWTAPFSITEYPTVPHMVAAAGGGVWSPFYKDLSAEKISTAHKLGLEVFTWTVNEEDDMRRIIDWSVDGIISDYPDRLRYVAQDLGIPVPQVV